MLCFLLFVTLISVIEQDVFITTAEEIKSAWGQVEPHKDHEQLREDSRENLEIEV